MTLDERNRMIEDLVDDVADWEYDKLLGWAQEELHQLYSHMDPETLQVEYDNFKDDKDD